VADAGRQVKQGLIWVWAESGPVAFIESAAAPPVVDPLREQAESWSGGFTNYVRDVPGCATKQRAASCVELHVAVCALLHILPGYYRGVFAFYKSTHTPNQLNGKAGKTAAYAALFTYHMYDDFEAGHPQGLGGFAKHSRKCSQTCEAA